MEPKNTQPSSTPIGKFLLRQFPDAALIAQESVAEMEHWKGAYVLAIHLPSAAEISIKQTNSTLESGWFTYAGSANGPGGVRARLARHFRPAKKLHWHVDQLTTKADQIFALAIQHGSECAIIDVLMQTKAMHFPIDGFGSSDCSTCRSHLMSLSKRGD